MRALLAYSVKNIKRRLMTKKDTNKNELSPKVREEYIYLSLAVIGGIIYSILVFSGKNIWSDEAFSFGMIRLSFCEIWNLPAVDVHPPLYYFYLKCFTQIFGNSLISTKFASVIPALFILVFGGWQIYRLQNVRTGILFMTIYMAFPPLLLITFEVRMYTLATAFVFANIIFAYRCANLSNKMDWFWLAICSVGAAYTHYYAFVAVGLIDLALLVVIARNNTSKLKYLVGSFALMVLVYLPWCSHLFGQLKYKAANEYWISSVTLISVCGYIYKTFMVEGLPLFTILLGLSFLTLLIWSLKKGHEKTTFLLLLPTLVAAIGVAVSLAVRPVMIFRYLIPSLCVWPVFAATVLDHMLEMKEWKKFAIGILSVIILCEAVNAVSLIVIENSEPENSFDKAWVEEQDCDTYLVATWSTHASTVLACYEEEKSIYARSIESGDANPFPNIYSYDSFDRATSGNVILLIDHGVKVTDKIAYGYSYNFKGDIIEGDGDVYDVYELIPNKG